MKVACYKIDRLIEQLTVNAANIIQLVELDLINTNGTSILGEVDILIYHLSEYDNNVLNELKLIKKKHPLLPVIITSNHYIEFLSFWCLRNDIKDYVILFEEQCRLKENLLSMAESKLEEEKLLKVSLGFNEFVSNKKDEPQYFKTKKALQYISKNYRNRIKVEELASVCNYSVPAFTVLFKKEHGLSPMVYLNKYRISIAKSMLVTSKSSISDIAYQCGFEDVAYFSKVFKKHVEATPRGYRET